MKSCLCPFVYGCVLDVYTNYNNYYIESVLHRFYLLFTLLPVFWAHVFLLQEPRSRNGNDFVSFNYDNIFNAIFDYAVSTWDWIIWQVCGRWYSVETDRDSVMQSNKCPKVLFKASFLRLINWTRIPKNSHFRTARMLSAVVLIYVFVTCANQTWHSVANIAFFSYNISHRFSSQ